MEEDYNRFSPTQVLPEKQVSEDPIKIFYSYSRKDLDMRNALEDHLSTLREAGKISTWHDLQLEAGTEWEPAILHKLDTADIILLLISSGFIASKYCYGTELKRAIARHDTGTARVIPIILRDCDWNHPYVPFSKLNVLPTHANPIASWANQDEAFAIVAKRIRETVDQLNAQRLAEQKAEERRRQKLLAPRAVEQKAEWERLQREQQRRAEEEKQQQELDRQQRPKRLRKVEQRQGSLTRRQVLQWATLAGVGVVGVTIVSQLGNQSPQPSPSLTTDTSLSPSQTQSQSPRHTPSLTASVSPTPKPTNEPVVYSQNLDIDPDTKVKKTGTLRANETVSYILSGDQGQQLNAVIADAGVLMTLLGPNRQPLSDQSNRVSLWQGTLPYTGSYSIQVSPVKGLDKSDYRLDVSLSTNLPK